MQIALIAHAIYLEPASLFVDEDIPHLDCETSITIISKILQREARMSLSHSHT